MKEKILTDIAYKSFAWAGAPMVHDSLFREYDLRAPIKPLEKGGKPIAASLNDDGMRVLGMAYGTYIQRHLSEKRAIVGFDYRHYSRGMSFAFITGLLSTGVDVTDIGLCVSPLVYFAQHHLKVNCAAMITASHNENGWTGLKLANGLSKTFEPEHIVLFKKLVYSGDFLQGAGRYERLIGIRDEYIKDIVARCRPMMHKRKLKVVVSTGNGGAGAFLPDILSAMGFYVIPVNCEPDWDFPNFNPNPENILFLEQLGKAVVAHKADLGVAADGDGDRFGVVDEKGIDIPCDRAGLFIARAICQKVPGRHIVIDVKSTGAYQADPVLKQSNTAINFCKTGHSYVKAAARSLDAIAGFEKSGHFFLRGRFGYGYDDACLSASVFCSILTAEKGPLSSLIAEQAKSFQSPTMEPSVANDKLKYQIAERITKKFEAMHQKGELFAGKKIAELITLNGVRVVLDDNSWGLVRASSNLPVLVIVIESFSTRKMLYDIFDEIQKHLEKEGIKRENYDQLLPPYQGE